MAVPQQLKKQLFHNVGESLFAPRFSRPVLLPQVYSAIVGEFECPSSVEGAAANHLVTGLGEVWLTNLALCDV